MFCKCLLVPMDISLASVDLSSPSHSFLHPLKLSSSALFCFLRCLAVSSMLFSSPSSYIHCRSVWERQVGCSRGGSLCSDTSVLILALRIGGRGLCEGGATDPTTGQGRGQVQLQEGSLFGSVAQIMFYRRWCKNNNDSDFSSPDIQSFR